MFLKTQIDLVAKIKILLSIQICTHFEMTLHVTMLKVSNQGLSNLTTSFIKFVRGSSTIKVGFSGFLDKLKIHMENPSQSLLQCKSVS